MNNVAAKQHDTEELKDAGLQIDAFRELPPIKIPASSRPAGGDGANVFDAEVYGICGACQQPAVYDAIIEYGRFSCYLTESHAPPHTDRCRDEGPSFISGYRRFQVAD